MGSPLRGEKNVSCDESHHFSIHYEESSSVPIDEDILHGLGLFARPHNETVIRISSKPFDSAQDEGVRTEWRLLKPYIGLFRNYWRFHVPIDEITSKGSSCSLFSTRAVCSNSYVPSCRCGSFLRINPLRNCHSWLSIAYPAAEFYC